ncbi:hypothetical protein BKA57DRAFT_533995 [Linnemannia elongata]|nr:hypothetical protein BKA57DRAFT_533995 [Linnemannia elongata]
MSVDVSVVDVARASGVSLSIVILGYLAEFFAVIVVVVQDILHFLYCDPHLEIPPLTKAPSPPNYTSTTYYDPKSALAEGKALYLYGGRAVALTDANFPSNQTFLLSQPLEEHPGGLTLRYKYSNLEFNMAAIAHPINNSVYVGQWMAGRLQLVQLRQATDLNPTSADIFIFDVATLTWTEPYRRINRYVVRTPTIVYNLKINGNSAWQKNFSPDSVVAPSHVGAIVGGVPGGLALISEVVLGFVVYRRKKRAGAEKHSLSREEEGITSRSNSHDTITLKHKEGVGTQRASYVVHAPVTTDISPMTLTGCESSAYTAIGYAQPSSQPQPQVYNSVGATPVIDGSMYYSPQFQNQQTTYQLPPQQPRSFSWIRWLQPIRRCSGCSLTDDGMEQFACSHCCICNGGGGIEVKRTWKTVQQG